MYEINALAPQPLTSEAIVPPIHIFKSASLLRDTHHASGTSLNLVVIDSHVVDAEQLIAGFPGAQVLQLNGQENGLHQISQILSQYQNIASLSVIAHGSQANLQLGNSWLNAEVLASQAEQIQSWRQHFTADGDILFYGCNIGAGNEGARFVQTLSQLTETDVAASHDLTGNVDLGGDWDLEVTTGTIEAGLPNKTLLAETYSHVLALGPNLVLNSSFENAPGAINNNWALIPSLPRWIRTAGSPSIEVLRNFEGGAAAGSNYLEMDSTGNYSIAQDIPTTPGQRYRLAFDYSPDRFADAASNTLNVRWNGQQVAAVAQSGSGLAGTRWQTFAYTVTATSNLTRLEFQGAGTSDGNGALLDRVRVRSLAPSSPTIALERNTYTVNEVAGRLEFAVIRSGDSSQAASVQYEISSGTAQAGSDFNGAGGTIAFAPGETRKTASIPIFNDILSEPSETFTFLLTGPVGAQLGTVRTATATILDDDNPALIVNAPAVSENAGNAVITLTRGNAATAASVDFATANGTAQAGSDFIATSGRVTFGIGETSKTIRVPLVNDGVGEPTETFTVNFTNPIGLSLTNSSQAVNIIDDDDAGSFVRETFIAGLNQPTAFAYTPNRQLMFILEKSGVIKVAQGNTVLPTAFANLSRDVNDVADRGALSIAVHPNFYNGNPYIYVAYTYDPPEAYQNINPTTHLDDPDGEGNRPARVVRLTADASTNYTRVLPNSQVVILGKNSTWANISRPDIDSSVSISTPESGRTADGGYVQDYVKTDSITHTIGHLAFGADGALYISVGDGTSYNLDPRTVSVQQLDSLSGKLLRVDPLTGAGLPDNPFYNGNPDSNRSKVWNLGLRNTFRFVFQPGTSTAFMGDVGWTTWEEINVSSRGANFGWPGYEGGLDSSGNPVSLRQSQYDNLNHPILEAVYQTGQVTAPIFARNHSTGARAVIMGDFYDGNTFPSLYNGALFIADVNQGTVNALTINSQNQVTAVRQFATGVPGIVYMETGADGNLYYVDLFSGLIGRWRPV